MERIKDTLKSIIAELTQKKGLAREAPEDVVQRTFLPKELQHLSVSSFKKGTLLLKVDSSAWRYYFNMRAEEILDRLKTRLPEIKEIRFNVGDISRKKKSGNR